VTFEAPAPIPVVAEPTVWPEGTSALCKNGQYSESQSRSGTCSWRGGVAFWRYPAAHPYWRRGSEA